MCIIQTGKLAHYFCCLIYICNIVIILPLQMPPKKKKLIGFLNYSKRKDVELTGEGDIQSGSGVGEMICEGKAGGDSSGELMVGAGGDHHHKDTSHILVYTPVL